MVFRSTLPPRTNGWIRLPMRFRISTASCCLPTPMPLVSEALRLSADDSEGEGESLVERRQRPASVTADVKALFNGSNSGGQSQLNPAFRSVDDSLGFAGPLSYHDPRRVSDYWQPTSVSSRTDSEASKRDSDPTLQDKLRLSGGGVGNGPPQSHAARAVSARTQSLDITSLNFSRALTGQSSAFGPVPPSPGAASSSPGTATSQYFPGSHAPSALRANVTGRPVSSYEASYDGVDSVTQGEQRVRCSTKQKLTRRPVERIGFSSVATWRHGTLITCCFFFFFAF